MYVVVISAAGLGMLGTSGLMSGETLGIAGWLAPGFVIGIVLGSRLFARFSDKRFRRFTMAFMLLVALGVLVA